MQDAQKQRVNDTICAVSTPPGVGGIAVVRLSGQDARQRSERFLLSPKGKQVRLVDHRVRLCDFVVDGRLVDNVVAAYFAAPHSYTGQDVVELSCHGSAYVQQRILQVFVDSGARLADPGEFTMRAFLNGRLDLSQAEAVADLIDSHTEAEHALAVSQLRGGYAAELEQLRQELVDLAALLELELDFGDEDVEFASRTQIAENVAALTAKVRHLVSSFKTGNAIKNGVPVAIAGRPNVGKSTLLNALLNEERAIVSDQAGTTRDTIEEQFVIDGIRFRLIDTAGLRHTDNEVEQAGIGRSFLAMRQASIILYIVDASDDADEVARQMGAIQGEVSLHDKTLILLRNKTDRCDSVREVDSQFQTLCVSARTGLNLAKLRALMADAVRQGCGQGDTMLTNARHYEAMQRVLSALDEVRKGMDANLTPDLLVIDIRDALYHLGTITGKVSSDEVLSSVFGRFCIGK